MPLDSTDSTSGPQYRKPTLDLYTVLLLIALVALALGAVGLYLDMSGFDFKLRGAPAAGAFRPAAALQWALALPAPGPWSC